MMPNQIEIRAYTDGACSGNPGPGGWGVLLIAQRDGETKKERALSGGALNTTNNRMELTAAAEALEALERATKLTLITDSVYVRDGITQWIHGWKAKGWKRGGKPIKNQDLWKRLDDARRRHDVTWEWVKGHAGNPQNERADALAREGMKPYKDTQDHKGTQDGYP